MDFIMKKQISLEDLDKTIYLLQPSRPIFCTTKNSDGTDHVAPFSWIMPISFSPPKVVLALQNERGSKHSQSLINILREREFGVNMPHMGQEKELVQSSYGLVHHVCKFDRTGYTREDAQIVKPKLIAECTASLECKVFSAIDSGGDHTLLMADVVGASYDDAFYDDDLCPIIPKLLPLLNLRDYRFDDKQEHIFIDTAKTYSISVEYEK